ncbi:MAG: hypothetical protein AAF968_00405 [Pseudomonadota bacterium]
MTAIDRFAAQETPTAPPQEMAVECERFVLQRHGQRPLIFEGAELAMASSYLAGTPNWFELNIYRTVEGRFVVRIEMFANAADQRGMSDAWDCSSFGEVMDTIERWDAGKTVHFDFPSDHADLSIGELTAVGLTIRARVAEARRQFSAIVGELLMDLDS